MRRAAAGVHDLPVHWSSVFEADVAALRRAHPGQQIHAHALCERPADPRTRILTVMPTDPVGQDELDALPMLEAVITRSDGHDHLDLHALTRRGVQAYHLRGYATESVAHLALTMTLSLLRRLPEAHHDTQRGTWDRSRRLGRHLGEVTVGLWGTGRIGGRLAHILSGLGATVVAHDLTPDAQVAACPGVRYVDGLEDLLRQSDVLSLHVPLTATTRGAIDRKTLALLPRDALLVNTARGDLIDQAAVRDALDEGRLAGYAADVLPGEPTPPHLRLFTDHPRVLLTPHLGAHNHETLARRYQITGDIVQALLEGRAPGGDYAIPTH